MWDYRSNRYQSYNKHRSAGHKRALNHIREAEALSIELGKTDRDVKQYFFSLSSDQLKKILDKYESKYGKVAREYAEKTLPSWKSGKVKMSGLVTERLFNFLPPIMPLEAKFQLIESLWKHVGPSSIKKFYVNPDVNFEDVAKQVKEYLEEVVINYQIPASMEARFNWLSQGDVIVKQQLLNHFRQQEKQLLYESLRVHLPILLDHLKSEKGKFTSHTGHILKVGKHEVHVIINPLVNEVQVRETLPDKLSKSGKYYWIWLLIGFIFFLWLLKS